MAAVTAAAVPAAATAADIPHIVGKTAPAECSAGALLKRTPPAVSGGGSPHVSSSTVPSGRINRSVEGVLRSAVRDAMR